MGATGQIGRAAVHALAADGWEVTAGSRTGDRDETWPAEVRTVRLDRQDDAALATALGGSTDVLVDVVAYRAEHARQLSALSGRIGSAVVISSVSVYEDERGRSIGKPSEDGAFPRFPVPMTETHSTAAPDDATYAGGKAAVEQGLLAAPDLPTTVLRAGAVHGVHSGSPRELYFVKRAVDGRPVRILAYGGFSRFHPAHVSNLGELIRLAANNPGDRALNAVDPQAPTVAEIAAAIDRVMGVRSEIVGMDGAWEGTVGDTPWSGTHPVVLDMGAAERELGYRAVTGYEESLAETVEWLTERLRGRDWRKAFPTMAKNYGDGLFDYTAEDAWLARNR